MLCLRGDAIVAEEHYKNALQIWTVPYGKEKHINIADCYNNLGDIRQLLGDLVKAKEYLKKSLDIKISCY